MSANYDVSVIFLIFLRKRKKEHDRDSFQILYPTIHSNKPLSRQNVVKLMS